MSSYLLVFYPDGVDCHFCFEVTTLTPMDPGKLGKLDGLVT